MKRALLIGVLCLVAGCGGEETNTPCDSTDGGVDAGDGGRYYTPAILCAALSKYQTREPGVPCLPACRGAVDDKHGVVCQCPGGGDNCSPGDLVWQSVDTADAGDGG